MDRIWQWAWDRWGSKYSWAVWGIMVVPMLVSYLVLSSLVVSFEKSGHYAEAAAYTVAAVVVDAYVVILPGSRLFRLAQRWAAGHEVDRAEALDDTYTWTRAASVRALWFQPAWTAVLLVAVGAMSQASGARLIEYGILGATLGVAMALMGLHTAVQAMLRPARAALAGDTAIGDTLPRSRPTFAAWLNLAFLGAIFTFAIGGALLAVVLDRTSDFPVLTVVVTACAWTAFAVPVSFSPSPVTTRAISFLPSAVAGVSEGWA